MLKEKFDLSGRTALVTGSSRGIGRAIALALAEYGADVIVHGSKDSPQAEEVCSQIQAMGRKTLKLSINLADDGAPRLIFEQARQTFDKIDILVLNASIQVVKSWQEITRQDFELQVNTNFRANLELLQLFAPGMCEHSWGRILIVGSVQQAIPHPLMLVYSGLKSAMLNVAQNLAIQLAPYGVTVNNLAPGVIDTDRNKMFFEDAEILRRTQQMVPLKFIGLPEDCAGAALLLCSEAGRYITGSDLMVDGGWRWARAG